MPRPCCKLLRLWGYIQKSQLPPIGDLPRIGKIIGDLHKQDYLLGRRAGKSIVLFHSPSPTTFSLVERGFQPFPIVVCILSSLTGSFSKRRHVSSKRPVRESKLTLHRYTSTQFRPSLQCCPCVIIWLFASTK